MRTWNLLHIGSAPLKVSGLTDVLVRGTAKTFLVRCAAIALALLLNVVLARILGVAEYGIYAYVTGWLQLLVLLSVFGIDNTTVRFCPQYKFEKDWTNLRGLLESSSRLVLATSTAVALVTLFILYVGRGAIAPKLSMAMAIGCLLVPMLSAITVNVSVLRAFRFTFLGPFLETVLYPALSISLILALIGIFSADLDSCGVQCVNVACAAIVWFYVSRTARSRLPQEVRSTSATYKHRTWITVSFSLFLCSGFNLINARSDMILVGVLIGTEYTGLYNIAAQMANLVYFPLACMSIIATPIISELYHSGRLNDLQQLLRWVALGVLGLSIPIAGVLFFNAVGLLSLYGDSFVQAERALRILIVAQLVNALAGPVGFMMAMTGDHVRAIFVTGVYAALNVGLNFILIPHFGIMGAAVATCLTLSLWNISLLVLVLRKHGVHSGVLALVFPSQINVRTKEESHAFR